MGIHEGSPVGDAVLQRVNPLSKKIARNTSVRLGRSVVCSFVCAFARTSRKNWDRRDQFRPRIDEIGAILAIFELSEVRKFCLPFFGEFGRSSQDLRKSDDNSPKSWDDRLNSPKSGMCIVGDCNTRNVVFATQGASCLEQRECPASNTRNVML